MNSEVTGQDNVDVISTIYNAHVSSYYLHSLKKRITKMTAQSRATETPISNICLPTPVLRWPQI